MEHTHACAYARLALSVWLNQSEKFAEFDRFLFQNDRPPRVWQALGEANRLLGQMLNDPEIADSVLDLRLQRGIALFHSLGLERTPVLVLSNGLLQGHVPTQALLEEVIQKDARNLTFEPKPQLIRGK